jgi:hypothetical protein
VDRLLIGCFSYVTAIGVLYQTPAGHWLTNAANYGNLVITGNIARVHPVATLIVAVGYAAAALSTQHFLPRYKGGRHSCFGHPVNCSLDDHDRAMMRDTTDYLAEGAIDPTRSRKPHQISASGFS